MDLEKDLKKLSKNFKEVREATDWLVKNQGKNFPIIDKLDIMEIEFGKLKKLPNQIKEYYKLKKILDDLPKIKKIKN